MKSGAGFSGRGFRKAASMELFSKKAWSLDAGATDHGEGILALGWEREAGPVSLGLQAGILGDISRRPDLTWWMGATARF